MATIRLNQKQKPNNPNLNFNLAIITQFGPFHKFLQFDPQIDSNIIIINTQTNKTFSFRLLDLPINILFGNYLN